MFLDVSPPEIVQNAIKNAKQFLPWPHMLDDKL